MSGPRHGGDAPADGIFRPAAVAHHRSAASRLGEVLRLSPAWLAWTYRLLLAFGLITLGVLCFCRVDEEIAGPAVVQGESGVTVTADVAGTVAAVTTLPGRRVRAGETLLVVASAGETDGDGGSRIPVVAPAAGLVADVLVRPGETVTTGTPVAVLRSAAGKRMVAAALPVRQGGRPTVGMEGVFRPAGEPRRAVPVILTAVADAAVSGGTAGRFTGGGVMAAGRWLTVVGIAGDGRDDLDLPNGMRGTLWVRIGRRRLIVALLPGLTDVAGKGGDDGTP